MPLAVISAAPAAPPSEIAIDLKPADAPSPAPVLPAPSPGAHPSGAAAYARFLSPPVVRWLARGAAVAALGGAAVVGGRYLLNALPTRPTPKPIVETTPVRPLAAQKATGGLRVSSTPAGAEVLVDGKARGVTPLRLTDLSPGRHEVTLTSDAGTVRRSVTVAANETAAIDEAIFSGWITVYAPFDVAIVESGRVLRPDDRNQIMLSAGTHELRLTNRALGYDAVRQVDVKPGEATSLQLTPEPSTMTVTATEAAEVWIDGARFGDTPLNAAPVPLGSHEVVVKRATGGERRFTVTIGVKPFTLNVDFQKPVA